MLDHLLVVDWGFLDSEWLTALHTGGTRVPSGVREDMLILEDMLNLSRLPELTWGEAEPPKIHTGTDPSGRS